MELCSIERTFDLMDLSKEFMQELVSFSFRASYLNQEWLMRKNTMTRWAIRPSYMAYCEGKAWGWV